MARRVHRYTIFDAMEENGVFEANPANQYARGPNGENAHVRQEYPKMLYHPEGLEVEVEPGEEVVSPSGKVRLLNRKTELVYELVNNAFRERELLEAGWHVHPAHALRAAGKAAPQAPAPDRSVIIANELEVAKAELAALREQLELAKMQGFDGDDVAPAAPERGVR